MYESRNHRRFDTKILIFIDFAQNLDFFKNHFLLNSIYFALQTTYKYVPYINQMRIISRSRRYLQIWPTTFTFRATAVQTGLINLGTVLSLIIQWLLKTGLLELRGLLGFADLLYNFLSFKINGLEIWICRYLQQTTNRSPFIIITYKWYTEIPYRYDQEVFCRPF